MIKEIVGLVGLFFGMMGTPVIVSAVVGEVAADFPVLQLWAAGWVLAFWAFML